jgi:Predicted membrane protein (DUF2232)
MIDTEELAGPPVAAARRSRLDVRTIAEASLLLDVTVLLVLLRTFLPIPGFQGLVRLACPMPFVLLAVRRGPRAGLIATVSAYLLLSTFIGPVFATQVLVFGGLGTLFAWASKRRLHPGATVFMGALLYGLLYLLPPFLIGLLVLRINVVTTLQAVQHSARGFLEGLGHLHLLGVPVGPALVSFVSSFPAGQAVLNGLHGAVFTLLLHPYWVLVIISSAYSLVNVWAYLVVSIELYRRLPVEARRDARGKGLDFFSVR